MADEKSPFFEDHSILSIRNEGEVKLDKRPLFNRKAAIPPKYGNMIAYCRIRFWIRVYSIILIFLSVFIYYISKYLCDPFYFINKRDLFSTPAFVKSDLRNQCPNGRKSAVTGFTGILMFYAFGFIEKLIFTFLYSLLLLYYGWETRQVKLEWLKLKIPETSEERRIHNTEMGLIVLQHLLILPFFIGGYFWIRHVHVAPSKKEKEDRDERRKETEKRLKRLRNEVNKYKEQERKDLSIEKFEQEKVQKMNQLARQVFDIRLAKMRRKEKARDAQRKKEHEERKRKKEERRKEREERKKRKMKHHEYEEQKKKEEEEMRREREAWEEEERERKRKRQEEREQDLDMEVEMIPRR